FVNCASSINLSPDSQHFPANVIVSVCGSFILLAVTALYFASYKAGRILSDMPPSTAIYVRILGTSLRLPTSYNVVPASPTSERPGSIQMAGIGYFASCAIAKTTLVMPSTYCSGGNGVSSSVYRMPKPPPKFKTGQTKLYCSRHANIL